MKIPRLLYKPLLTHLKTSGKGIVLYGPRQVGKTTLVSALIDEIGVKTIRFNGDRRGPWWEALVSREKEKIEGVIADYQLIFVDEAQRIPEIGLTLKIIRDEFPEKRLIVTGSSSLDLASKVSEPLTGRVYSWKLFPISQGEMRGLNTSIELETSLEERLIYGSYPEIFSMAGYEAKAAYLQNLINGYLYKDLLEFGGIRNSSKIVDLLKLLAFQIGSQVSINELASSLELNHGTVERYIDLLEKTFVIFRMPGFSRNLRKEVRKMDKIYFFDTGVRNAIIGNFNLLVNRNDAGRLWENFLVMERKKLLEYTGEIYSHSFWRLASGAELDLVEEKGGKLNGFEFKYSDKIVKPPKTWLKTYAGATFKTINQDNWQKFVIK